MSPSDSQTQNGKRSLETSEVFDPVFDFLMDFADKAETIVPQPKRISVLDEDDGETLEDGGDGNAWELFDKLPVRDKEELLKDVFRGIVGNMLDKLPEDGKEAFLVRCFDGLFPKLPCESQRAIEIKLKHVSSQPQEASPIPRASELSPPFPILFPADELVEVGYRRERVRAIGPERIRVAYPYPVAPRPHPRPRPRPSSPHRPGPGAA